MKMIEESWVWKPQRNPVILVYDCRASFNATSPFNMSKKVKIHSEHVGQVYFIFRSGICIRDLMLPIMITYSSSLLCYPES